MNDKKRFLIHAPGYFGAAIEEICERRRIPIPELCDAIGMSEDLYAMKNRLGHRWEMQEIGRVNKFMGLNVGTIEDIASIHREEAQFELEEHAKQDESGGTEGG